MKKEIIIPTLSLLIICIVAAALLSLTNYITHDRIAATEKEQENAAMRELLPDAVRFEVSDPDSEGVIIAYGENADGNMIGYTVSCMDKSYGGDIKVMTGIDTDGKITGIKILEINDTPGLGMNAQKDSFKNQFIGKTAGNLVVSKTATGEEIQALTGATRTSDAVTRCVNAAFEILFLSSEKGGN